MLLALCANFLTKKLVPLDICSALYHQVVSPGSKETLNEHFTWVLMCFSSSGHAFGNPHRILDKYETEYQHKGGYPTISKARIPRPTSQQFAITRPPIISGARYSGVPQTVLVCEVCRSRPRTCKTKSVRQICPSCIMSRFSGFIAIYNIKPM